MFKASIFSTLSILVILSILISAVVCDPVDVTKLQCDGDSHKCTADLDFGDGGWVAEWNINVFHRSFREDERYFRSGLF
ncbi:hypothetical protein BY458DRAFT_551997 [Sporodiniella umbellata]|nr:hypothetical protein BY458DRAFT_551997 [Sporodiniella umbellata]